MSNVNKVKRAPVFIELDGKQMELKFTLNSFAEMEDRYGTVDAALEQMQKGSIKSVRFMLWAGLIHSDDSITEKYVGGLIELQDLQELSDKLNAVMTQDLPDDEQRKAEIVQNPNA